MAKKRRRKAAKKQSKKVAKRQRKPASAMGRGADVSDEFSPIREDLEAHRARLATRRDELDSLIAHIDGMLGTIEGSPRASAAPSPLRRPAGKVSRRIPGGGGVTVRKGSLKDHIMQVMAGKGTMAVKDITSGVRKTGYKTRNKTLAKSVGIALAQMPNVEKVGRGQFRRVG